MIFSSRKAASPAGFLFPLASSAFPQDSPHHFLFFGISPLAQPAPPTSRSLWGRGRLARGLCAAPHCCRVFTLCKTALHKLENGVYKISSILPPLFLHCTSTPSLLNHWSYTGLTLESHWTYIGAALLLLLPHFVLRQIIKRYSVTVESPTHKNMKI